MSLGWPKRPAGVFCITHWRDSGGIGAVIEVSRNPAAIAFTRIVLDYFRCHRLGERNYPALGGTENRQHRKTRGPSNRSDIDDAAGLFGDHDLERFARAVKSGVKMRREH